MWKLLLLSTVALAQAGPEWHLSLAPLSYALGGQDVHVAVKPPGMRWRFGFAYQRFTSTFRDPFTGRELTETVDSLAGPTAVYLWRPQAAFSPMVGGAVFRCSKRETSLLTGEVGRDAATGAFVGGGFGGCVKTFTYAVGIYLGPGIRLKTETSVSSEEDSGAIYAQLHVGFRF